MTTISLPHRRLSEGVMARAINFPMRVNGMTSGAGMVANACVSGA